LPGTSIACALLLLLVLLLMVVLLDCCADYSHTPLQHLQSHGHVCAKGRGPQQLLHEEERLRRRDAAGWQLQGAVRHQHQGRQHTCIIAPAAAAVHDSNRL
jgi:hypothetical protein